ncbi:heavy-metal-associated domain-containing protein [Thiospirillum jenense]|uniref:Heavy-metal-associated domain-containing protein n=2 Tax=Thiospirillum jenense TaxID=1653858 RepID=A0A839HC40_9GAMM|nr:heavy-metal-associated domain-containing protein [Thiospirillum jenense]
MIHWQIDNVKCDGCANRIRHALSALPGVNDVTVNVAQHEVCFAANENQLAQIEAELLRLGYPRSGQVNGFAAIKADVVSVVSCAIGRMQS